MANGMDEWNGCKLEQTVGGKSVSASNIKKHILRRF